MEQELLQSDPQEPTPISGWLAFFLWVGVGLGAIVSCIRTIVCLADIGWTPFSILVFTGYLGSLVVVAVLTIIAFYQRKENAVSLAITYVLMIALDGVLQITFAAILDDDTLIKDIIRSFVWSITWFSYLMCSKQVKEQIPAETRIWRPTELILLAVFIISGISYCTGLHKMAADPTNTNLVSKEYLVKSTIEEANKDFPQTFNGLVVERIDLKGLMITYYFKFPQTTLSEMDAEYLKKYTIARKQELLYGYATETDEEINKINDLFFNNGYDVCYYYKDKDNLFVYSVVTTPSDYKKAKEAGKNFRCDKSAWNELISQTKKELPIVYMGDCYLNNVSVDFNKNIFIYKIQLPDMEDYLIRQYITEEYIKKYIRDNIGILNDNFWTLASIDKFDLEYRFITSSGSEHINVKLPYKEYSQYQ